MTVAVTSVLAWRCECGIGRVRVGSGPKTWAGVGADAVLEGGGA